MGVLSTTELMFTLSQPGNTTVTHTQPYIHVYIYKRILMTVKCQETAENVTVELFLLLLQLHAV